MQKIHYLKKSLAICDGPQNYDQKVTLFPVIFQIGFSENDSIKPWIKRTGVCLTGVIHERFGVMNEVRFWGVKHTCERDFSVAVQALLLSAVFV